MIKVKSFVVPFVALAALLFAVNSAFSITIDEFEGDQEADAGFFESDNSAIVTPIMPGTGRSSSIGGTRELAVQGLTGSTYLRTRIATGLGFLSHSQDAGASGQTKITWDGNTNPALFNQSGLGVVDFTQDGASAIDMEILSFDSPANQSVELKLFVYGAGNRASVATVTLATEILSLTTVSVPFAAFAQKIGATAPVDWTKVGAVELLIVGYAEDIDIRLEWIGTNSVCRLAPDAAGKVLDQCGVCGGDDSSCKDCLGVPNGTAVPGTSCTSSLPGVCSTGTFTAGCGCQATLVPGTEICDGLDNDCDGSVDETFPTLGQTCSGGTAPCDFTGTYTCDGSGAMKCDIPNLATLVKNCEDSKGCDGVPNSGLVYDSCNVCGGNGTACIDCAGQPFGTAAADRCGACEGDGLSCLGCNEVDQTALLRTLDGGAKAQERLVNKILRQLTAVRKDVGTIRYAKKASSTAHELMLRNWTISWWLPRVSTTCQNKTFCVQQSNLPILEEYRIHSEELRMLAVRALRRLLAARGNVQNSMTSNFGKALDTLHLRNMKLADTVPVFESVCTK